MTSPRDLSQQKRLHMKRLLVVALSLMLTASTASAIGFGGGVHGGVSFSSFPKAVKDYYGTGFGFGAHGDLKIIKYLTARLNVDYHMFSSDKNKIIEEIARDNNVATSDLSFEGFNASVLGITLNGIGRIPLGKSPVTPYGLAGLGINILSISDPKLTYQGQDVTSQIFGKPETETKFGINFGAGAEFALAGFSLYAEVKYVIIFTENENTSHIPITVGVILP